jgi:site-specific DNA-methyltransferase (adenine-specific)
MSLPPGLIRDAVIRYLASLASEATLSEITAAVRARLGDVSPSSVRSYLNLNVPETFLRVGRGRYRLAVPRPAAPPPPVSDAAGRGPAASGHQAPALIEGRAVLHHADCFDWLAGCPPASIHAVITDPPYGLIEYSPLEQGKLRSGRGGVWRIPPAFDGHQRAPLPRFTTLKPADRLQLHAFFLRLAVLLGRAVVPGANIMVASNPLLAHIVASAMAEGGLEMRGTLIRLTMTMRGGDRPKNAHTEFGDVSVMPRSMWEPWVLLRRPLEGRVQDNLRRWKTGGFLRLGADQPFGDVIRSGPTPRAERLIAPHPSLKPQSFLRHIVRAALPRQEGVILDPFAGSGSTLAAANAVGYASIGVEADETYVALARTAVPALAALPLVKSTAEPRGPKGLDDAADRFALGSV